ncbi:MAG: hypothetical protein OES57_18525 [Acidimicrobiia bacterium]|nr:hypothetical protein [Acidimicrobiia bacterium]
MLPRPLLVLVVLATTLANVAAVDAQSTEDDDSGDPCAAVDLVAIVAVFTGEPENADDESLTFTDIDVEEGDVNTPVVVQYPQGLPVLDDVGAIRVRAFEGESGLQSEVECGATTDINNELLELDDDRLAAIARTAGDLSSRLGRWALIACAVLFAAVMSLTVYRRWRPRLW